MLPPPPRSTLFPYTTLFRSLQRGRRSAHPFAWLLSSPQQPLETEDPPTVSLAPQYTSQPLCRAIEDFLQEKRVKFLYYCHLFNVTERAHEVIARQGL